jgi:hypothetical protein
LLCRRSGIGDGILVGVTDSPPPEENQTNNLLIKIHSRIKSFAKNSSQIFAIFANFRQFKPFEKSKNHKLDFGLDNFFYLRIKLQIDRDVAPHIWDMLKFKGYFYCQVLET